MSGYIVHKAVEPSALSAKRKAELESQVNDYLVSPKYDGCHAIFCFDGGVHVGTYSRSGEVVRSMDHIARSLLDLYPLQAGRIAIAGEAWMLGKEFNEVSGAFRRHANQPDLCFVPFDVVPFDYNEDTTSGPVVLLGQAGHHLYSAEYEARLMSLLNQRQNVPSNVLAPRWMRVSGTLTEVLEIASIYAIDHKSRTDNFYDGAVVALASGKYSVGSGKGGEFLKVKPLISFSVIVHGCEADKGDKTGKNTVALLFNLNGKEQRVSTGLRQDQVDDIVDNFKPNWKDVTIEVEAMGLTVNGFLREPRFKGIRTDA